MTVDSKYANLPWMARDETDVYETEDLPESDQLLLQTDDSSIHKIDIKVEDAKKVFDGKLVNSEDVDFSDRIRMFVNTGYSVDTSEYVLYPDGQRNLETPLQRFQRLQHEVRDLMDVFEDIKSLTASEANNQLLCDELLSLGREMGTITHQLSTYNLHCSLGADVAVGVEVDDDLCGQDARDMLEEMERFASKHKKNDSSGDQLTWERYYQSPVSKELDNAKLADLNQRVQRLESTLGFGDRDLNVTTLNSDLSVKSLLDAVKMLTSRCQPLKGGPNVDKIETRLLGLQPKLQSITEKRDIITEADRQNKIAELFTLVQKWKELQPVLPVIVKRLADLQELHNLAIHFSDSTSFLDKNHTEMRKNIVVHQDQLTKIEKELNENTKKIKSVIESMETRVNKL